MAGMLVGVLSVIGTVFSRAYLESLFIRFTNPLIVLFLLFTRLEMWYILLLIPVLEEIIYRGLFLNRLMHIFSGNRLFASAIAIVSYSIILDGLISNFKYTKRLLVLS